MARLELGVDFGVDEVRGDGDAEEVVEVRGEGLEGRFVAHEAVDVD